MRRIFAPLLIALGLAVQALGATTNFDLTNAAVSQSGKWGNTFFGGTQLNAIGQYSQFDWTATGTACSVRAGYLNSAGDFTVSIDGGAYANIVPVTYQAYAVWPLYTGLSDAPHTVSIKSRGAPFGALESLVSAGGGISVTGASPSIAMTAGFGPQLVFTDPAVSPYVAASPGITVGTVDGYSSFNATNIWPDMEIDLPSGSCATLKLWCSQNGQKYCLRVDGVNQSTVTASTDTTYKWLTLATGLPTTGSHTYSIHQVNNPTLTYSYAVMTSGGTGLTGTAPAQAKECWAFFGDSITVASAGTGDDSSLGFASRMTRARGVWCVNRGWGGTLVWTSVGGHHAGEDRVSDVTTMTAVVGGSNVSVTPSKVIILYGVNDFLQADGAETTTQFQTASINMLTTLKASISPANVIYLGLLDRAGGGLATWRTAQGTAAATTGYRYYPTEGWIDPTLGVDTSDGLHPNASGYTKIAAKLLAIMPPVARPPVKPSRSR